MSCEATRDRLLELPAERFGELAHLRECPRCRHDAERIAEVERELDTWLEAFAEAEPTAALARAHQRAGEDPRRSRARLLAPLLLAAAVLLSLRPLPAPLGGQVPETTTTPHLVAGDGDFVVLHPRDGLTIVWHP